MENSARARKLVRFTLNHIWSPVGAGVKSEEEVDALGLYLFGDGPEGAEHARGIDETIAEVPGLEYMTLIQDYLEQAKRRVADRPGWAGLETLTPSDELRATPAPAHWRESEEGRVDVMPATSDVERREEEKMTAHLSGEKTGPGRSAADRNGGS